MAGAVAALALPRIDFAQPAAVKNRYPAKALDLVERSVVIDMLAPLKIDFRPEAYSAPLTEADAAMFLSSASPHFITRSAWAAPAPMRTRCNSSPRGAASWGAPRMSLPRWQGPGHRAREGQEKNCRHHGFAERGRVPRAQGRKSILRSGIALRATHL